MAIEAHDIREFIAELAAPTPREREIAAEKADDWIMPHMEARIAAAQLNAISSLSGLGLAPGDVLSARRS